MERVGGKLAAQTLRHGGSVGYGILYLVSDESAYVTGSELVIDGGFTA